MEGIDCGIPCAPCETRVTCSGGIQNKDEDGVDCCGSCPIACPGYCGDGIVDPGEECDDGNNVACDSSADNCLNEPAPGIYDDDLVIQNRGSICVTIDGANALSWVQRAAAEGDAEVFAEIFIRKSTSCGFALKSISNGNFVEIQNNKLSATGKTGVVFHTEACGTDPVGFGALRVDTDDDGDAFNNRGNF
jgi:cysteine-rich repeat protein